MNRIQRKCTAGWRMPENTFCIGRPTRWGNLYPVTPAKDRDPCVPEETYRSKLWTNSGSGFFRLLLMITASRSARS